LSSQLFIIDGSSLIHRAYHALPDTLKTAKGEVTNAVYGFVNMFFKLLDDEKPQRVVVAMDLPGPTFRHKRYEEYKANRPPLPEDFPHQIQRVREFLEAMGVPILEKEGFEADDIIGTLARDAQNLGWETVIVTGDKDMLQLVTAKTQVLLTVRGISQLEKMAPSGVKEKMGVAPSQIIDYKGLVGDSSDNIPGVRGIGPKTAVKLLGEFGSLEEIMANLGSLTPRQKEQLTQHSELALLSKELATIDCQVPIASLEKISFEEPHKEKVAAFLEELEFTTLLSRWSGEEITKSGPQVEQPEGIVITTLAQYQKLLAELEEAKDCSLLLLTESRRGAGEWGGKIMGLAVALSGERGYFIPQELEGAKDGALNLALSWLGNPAMEKRCHNAKWLQVTLQRQELDIAGITLDTMLAAYLLEPGEECENLDRLLAKFYSWQPQEKKQLSLDFGLGQALSFSSQLATKAALLYRLSEDLGQRLEADKLTQLYQDLELPLSGTLARMELAGIALDTELLDQLSGEMALEIKKIEEAAASLVERKFNLNSPKQLSQILFEDLGLKPIKKTKTGYSTDNEVLTELEGEHPLIGQILIYRQLSKLKSTYVDALPALVDPKTGRIHTNFHQAVTATGRLSSSDPNLQNIPIRSEEGGKIRKAFIPGEKGWRFLSADYSQIELRVLAHLAGDPVLIEAFKDREDIHSRTAAEIFGLRADEVTGELRSAAKAINFGIVYGISSFGLAKNTGISRSEAGEYIDRYFQRYRGVKEYQESVISLAKKQGYVTTLLGRRRYLPEITSRNWNRRQFAERMAMNTPVQGSAADLIKLAMLAVERRLRGEGLNTRMLLQVHDELLFEYPPSEEERLMKLVCEEMEGVMPLSVPLLVEPKTGTSWLMEE